MSFIEERRRRRYGDEYHIIKCPIPKLKVGHLMDYKGRAQKVEKPERYGAWVIMVVGDDEFKYPSGEHVWLLEPKGLSKEN